MAGERTNLLGMSREELSAFVRGAGQPAYRGTQLYRWLYARGARSFEGMTDIARDFRRTLEGVAAIAAPGVASSRRSSDGTVKLLFALEDGLRVESVLIPPASAFRGEAGEQNRLTLCVSTQVGCPLDCAFCATGTMGFRRNLSAGEIVGQVLAASGEAERRITNVVFMGMGEPLLNYEATMKAAAILTDGCGIAARHITVSTAGRADRIRRMADDGARVKLALSLHSAVDETRSRLMPINRKYGLRVLTEALEYYYRKIRQRVTYEVIFFDGVNDGEEDVRRLVALARRIPSKINIIPFHAIGFAHPQGFGATLGPSPRMEAIAGRLRAAHLTVMVRMSAGEDIDAACGQLALSGG
ncbi:MAG TPA: 23S rRNA (adenine(2503)-C(2))-methyltransferase RlmN [Bacteroidota bacterium]|nr:23S rRNA (adenine(2503)-C(2))-methyltransferase RlmN [Bacteroidota bacterium]